VVPAAAAGASPVVSIVPRSCSALRSISVPPGLRAGRASTRDGVLFPALDQLLGGSVGAPRPAELLERADSPASHVDLPPPESEAGRGGEGMVVVVPALAERRYREQSVVRALVGGHERPRAEHVGG